MTHLSDIFLQLKTLIQEEGQSEFLSVVIAQLLNNEDNINKQNIEEKDIDSYQLLRTFIAKICNTIDDLSSEILNDDSILISVKDQKLLRTCFQLVTSIGISPCLIPGLGISLSKRCSTSAILSQMKFKDDEKYDLLVACTNFFTRSYKVPVLKNIIITMHLSDYLAALIQLAFAPLKKPGTYPNFIMTQDKYNKLNIEREQFIQIYEHLVANCFQPSLMKELLVLQSVVDPAPPAFVKRAIAKELSRRLLAPGGLLSLIRCFIDTYDVDVGLEWKKIDMVCKIISTKHGNISDNDYIANITSQLTKILCLNNTHYLTTAVACVLCLKEKYSDSEFIKTMVKDIFQAFEYESLISKESVPGTIILSPNEVDHKVNVLHACICSTKTDWQVSLLAPNLHILFLIGIKCVKNEDLKIKLKDILMKCLEKLDKNEVTNCMTKFLFENDNCVQGIDIVEYDSGIAIKKTLAETMEINNSSEALTYFLDVFNSATSNDFVKAVFEASLEILINLSIRRSKKANKELLTLEEEPLLLDEIDGQYATILQILSEISTSPKVIATLKSHPSIVTNFIEHFLSKTSNSTEECVTIALVLLNTVLSNTDILDLRNKLLNIIPILKKMSQDESSYNHILCKEALSLMSCTTRKSESACEKAISDVFDNLLPVRAHGIMELTKLIDRKDAEAISKKHYLFCIFQNQLKDPDSYVYLSAINGLAALCTHCTDDVLQVLCKEFLQISTDEGTVQTNDAQNKISELRMKIGDVIVKVTRRLGEMAVVHKTALLNTMLCGCRDDDPLIRTSALSNLAEIALVLHYKMGNIIYEVLLCLWDTIETDKAIECRRAAVMVISSLLKGLGKETLVQLKENLLPIYRTIKSLYRDNNEDSIVRLHAQLALEELDDIVKQLLFPEVKMERQIFVLDKPEDAFK